MLSGAASGIGLATAGAFAEAGAAVAMADFDEDKVLVSGGRIGCRYSRAMPGPPR